MPEGTQDITLLDLAKFQDPHLTAKGETRARVALKELTTLWFNTGSLCNIACENCYMDSSPNNDRLAYLSHHDVARFLAEINTLALPVQDIGFTGGEPFMNTDIIPMLDNVLARGLRALVLTNAMKPLWQKRDALRELVQRHTRERLTLRVSIDHFTPEAHETVRGAKTWKPMEDGIVWLRDHGFQIDVAGRTLWGESEDTSRRGYQQLFERWQLDVDAFDPAQLVLFPEMDERVDVPEITTACWGILNVRPDAMMCATARMVVKRKDEAVPKVVPCTLLPYDPAFDLGEKLQTSQSDVPLNHPHCAKFCVLGGASCSAG